MVRFGTQRHPVEQPRVLRVAHVSQHPPPGVERPRAENCYPAPSRSRDSRSPIAQHPSPPRTVSAMTGPSPNDPLGYAAEELINAGVPVTVDRDRPLSPDEQYAGIQDHRELVKRYVETAARNCPPDWEMLHGTISMAGDAEITQLVVTTPGGNKEIRTSAAALDPIRMHRSLTTGEQGPWLRLLFDCDRAGNLTVAFDYGDIEIPADQLLSGEAYLQDLENFPRQNVPVWLLAHIGNEGQQMRSAAVARRDAGFGGEDVFNADGELPALPLLWARIAVLTAVSRGVRAPVHLRCDPTFEFYITDNGGCTLATLPGNRAVLSGGSASSRLLSTAYKGFIPWPNLYRGAPAWVHDLYLDPRAGRGMLSFCYWWDGANWWRSALPETSNLTIDPSPWTITEEIREAVPGVWTAESTAALVNVILAAGEVDRADLDPDPDAAIRLVRAADDHAVSEADLRALFVQDTPSQFDIAEAVAQLDAAAILNR